MARSQTKVVAKSGVAVARPPKVQRKPKAAAGPADSQKSAAKPAATATASKRKAGRMTKKQIHKRQMYEKKVARTIQREQARSHITACSRNGIKRMIKAALQTIGEENRIDETEPIFMPNVASKAVDILHQVIEGHMVTLCNEASFLLDYAGKSTFTPKALEAVLAMRKAREQQPVYQLPEKEPPVNPTPEEEEEEEAAFTDGSDGEGESESE